jgi:sialate O-acetylesterase
MNGPNRLASKKAVGHYRFPVALLLLGPLLAGSAQADVKLPAIFGDHMVLQRDLPVAVWGWADPGEAVTVRAGSSAAKVVAGANGKWMVKVGPLSASDQPIEMTVSGKNAVRFTDVLVGDVWICAGQSNMGFPLNGASNAATELPQAKHPRIHLFNVDTKMSFEPLADCTGKWAPCTPGTAQNFSAVGYFFGRDLHQVLKVPIGLVETSLGGTSAQAWTSLPGLRADPATRPLADEFEKTKPDLVARMEKYEKETVPRWQQEHELWRKEVNPSYQDALRRWNEAVRQAKADGKPEPQRPLPSRPHPPLAPLPNRHAPTLLSNGMLAPLVPLGIKGVIWYQGEANTDNPLAYRTIFPAMIRDWRRRWGQGDFPFLFVQLPNSGARVDHPGDSPWAGVREAQSLALSLPATGQAVTIDVGDVDVHPHNKVDVGRRLALVARQVVYGEKLVCSGPTFQQMQIEGGKARLTFTNASGGLSAGAAHASDKLSGFAVAGADRNFVWAQARIDGESVVVWSDRVPQPVAVRYGWADNPEVNLYNREGLPAAPFRTDDWPLKPAKK